MAERRLYVYIEREFTAITKIETLSSLKNLRLRIDRITTVLNERSWRKYVKELHEKRNVYIKLRDNKDIVLKESTL